MSRSAGTPTAPRADAAFARVATTLFLLALPLRPQLVGAAALVPGIQADLGISHAVAGLLGTIPVVCMGLFAPVAPLVAARLGTARAVGLAIALVGAFGLARAAAASDGALIVLTLGIGVGMGIAGALLPVVVKERLAPRPLAATISYSAGLQLGAAAAAALAVPLALALGGWRASLGAISVATLAVLVPAWVLAGRGRETPPRIAVSPLAYRDRRALALAGVFALFGAVYYGLIAWLPDAYVELGWTQGSAGALVGLLNVASLVGALSVGAITAHTSRDAAAATLLASGFAVAAIGFVAAPGAAPAWAVLAGYTNGALFPLILALPLRLADRPASVAAISSVMLGVGYTVAAVSPIALGAVRDAAGAFGPSLLLIAAGGVAFAIALSAVARTTASVGEAAPAAEA